MFGISQKNSGNLMHHFFIQIADDAEVNQADATVEHHDGIRGVRIGMKKTELHQLP